MLGGATPSPPSSHASMPIGPGGSWEDQGMSMRRAVGAAGLVLWEASLLQCRNASRLSLLFWGEASPGERSCASRSGILVILTSADVMPHPHNLARGRH